TANTTNILGLAPNTQYWVRVTARNGGGIPTNPGPSANATTQKNGVGSGAGSGLGTATLAPANFPEGGVVTTTVTFKVPPGAMSASDPLGDIASQPSQTFAVGQAQWIGYNPWNILTAVTNQVSPAITLQANDNCGQPAILASPVTINLYGRLSNGATDFGAA